MSKKLAGTILCFNGNKFDYCFKEAIKCLIEFCDYVIVVAGGDDGTIYDILHIEEFVVNKFSLLSPNKKVWESDRMKVIEITQEEWDSQHGKEKLSYFTNIAIQEASNMGFKYQFNLQSDEIISEKSYSEIRKAISDGDEGYMCKRINLWSSPYMQLDVPLDRMPCSTSIVRLAKTNYLSYDDAENVGVPLVNTYFEGGIRIYHMGFVRRREVMRNKIINMQCNVFGMEHYDAKLDQAEIFNPDLWFHPQNDLRPIDEPLPKLIQEWAKERVVFN